MINIGKGLLKNTTLKSLCINGSDSGGLSLDPFFNYLLKNQNLEELRIFDVFFTNYSLENYLKLTSLKRIILHFGLPVI